MNNLRVMHLASFCGNIGDNANHRGFKNYFEACLGRGVDWHEEEIREYYWRDKKFDEKFVARAHDFDLLIIGGGNYFELWVDDSPTGTSIALDPQLFKQIKKPIFFNALGVDAGQGSSESAVRKFTALVQTLINDTASLLSVRNDGSMQTLRKYIGEKLSDKFYRIPDGGFFAGYKKEPRFEVFEGKFTIGINLASDMSPLRFDEKKTGGYSAYCSGVANLCATALEDHADTQIIFFPHIFRDLQIIYDVIDKIPDKWRRTKISVSPYLIGEPGAAFIFGMYTQCDLIIGMRFHANVCAIGMGLPVIGLNSYPQIEYLYSELGLAESCIPITKGFEARVLKQIGLVRNGDNTLLENQARAMTQVTALRENFTGVLSDWLTATGLKKA